MSRSLGYSTRDPAPGRAWLRYITAIGHVTATTQLVGLKIIGTKDGTVDDSDENAVMRGEPEAQGLTTGPVSRQRIGFARAQDGFENAPDCGTMDAITR